VDEGVVRHPPVFQIANLAVLGLVLWLNALAGSGGLSGESIGLIANRYTSWFLPANYVFGIWSLIYLWLIAFGVYQVLPGQRTSSALGRLHIGWVTNGALNIAWIVAFSFSRFGSALVMMIALLVNLVWIGERIGWHRGDLSRGDRVFVAYPFALYLAWISVALISNTFQYLTVLEWGGWGIGGQGWAAIMMLVATGLGLFMVVHRGNWFFPIVFAWAFVGIADRHMDAPLVANTAWAATSLGLVGLVVGMLWRRGDRSDAPVDGL
jgi:benzodiazapine receptor